MQRVCWGCLTEFTGRGNYCADCSSSASSACSGEDARQADKASAVTQRSGDDVIADAARWAWWKIKAGIPRWVTETTIEGINVRITITRQE